MAVLEAKLNSVPGLDHIEAAKPPPAPASSTPAAAPAATATAAPTSQSTESAAATTTNAPTDNTAAAAAPVEEAPKAPSLADDPDYAPFFRLLKVGVPIFVVQAKASAAGLDPSAFENFTP